MSDTLEKLFTKNRLAEIALDEITRRLNEHDALASAYRDVELAMERAAQLIDYATARELTPKEYQGPMLKLYRAHRDWIEAKRALGQYPALQGTKAPVARPKRNRKR